MKLPSVNQILQGALRTFSRFPFVLCSALAGTIAALILIDYEGPEGPTILFKILFAAILGIPLLIGLTLVAEKRGWGRVPSLGAQAIGILLLVGYAFTVPLTLSFGPSFHIQRLLLLSVVMHLFVSVGPFLKPGEENGFWHYNKILLFRILGAALYSHILYAGLCLALAALDQLFGMDIPVKRYGELWIITFGILNTWLFLAGIPENLKSLENITEYPRSLKILVQYALAPLAMIYLVIVYAYIAKIAISLQWPEGWISKLILGFSVTGLLSLVLLYPVRDREEMRWVRPLFRWFYIIMIPLVIVFPLALSRRVGEYGITEARYVALILAGWLVFVVAYFLLSKGKSIKVIPASLALLGVAICFGPWGMFQVSEQSQTSRLEGLLVRDSILVYGSIQKASSPVPYELSKQISSILDYLHENHGFEGIQPWFRESLRTDFAVTTMRWHDPLTVANMLGIEYVRVWSGGAGNLSTFNMNADASIDVQGFERVMRLQYVNRGGFKKEIVDEGTMFEFNSNLDTLTIRKRIEGNNWRSLSIDLGPLAARLLEEYASENIGNVPAEKMTIIGAGEGIRAKVFLRTITIQRRAESNQINGVSLDIAYSK